jgi:GMP synthase (glutamine-hydrolysing)
MFQTVAVLDFGSQYTGLIARRLRELRVCARIFPGTVSANDLRALPALAGIVLSGGPDSVYAEGAAAADPRLLDMEIPILGICYGAQWLARALGGAVRASGGREGGRAEAHRIGPSILLDGMAECFAVWMSRCSSARQKASQTSVGSRKAPFIPMWWNLPERARLERAAR